MNQKRLLAFLCVLLFEVRAQAGPGVTVSVELKTFSNPKNLDLNGACCDPACARCNYYFEICIADTTNACVVSGTTTTWNNINDIVFQRGKIGKNLFNPMVKTLSSWKGVLKMDLKVQDYDYLSPADLVDKYSFSKRVTPTAGVLPQKWQEMKLTGVVSNMVVRYSVQCNRDYYGPSCTTHCIPRDDTRGHYTCDLQTGSKVCRVGWYRSDCLAYCMSRDDDTHGHYTCQRLTGNKVCLLGWYGASCKTFCLTRNDSQAGYTCDVTGKRVCLTGWYPTRQCDVYCEPRNDSTAGYVCDQTTGRKTCLTGWFGPECDCRPRNDTTAGFNCNATTGVKVCLPGWYGRHCNVPCTPRNDAIGHYTCNERTGATECLTNWFGDQCILYCAPTNKTTGQHECSVNGTQLCMRHWYGANCSVYCEPRDGNEGHYNCHSRTGQKVCLQGWYGGNCSTYCVARDNDWFGHFDCNADGTKRCNSMWYGSDCKVYCKPQGDSQGHYTCNASNGTRVCFPNWYGTRCLTYCRGRDDDLGHYRCNAVDGNRMCLQFWYGQNCTVKCVPRNDTLGHFTCDRSTGQKICMRGWGGENCEESTSPSPSAPSTETATTVTFTEEPITTIPLATESPTPPIEGKSTKRKKEKVLDDWELSLILGGFVSLLLLSVGAAVIVCSRRQIKKYSKPFPYLRHKDRSVKESKEQTSSTDEHHDSFESSKTKSPPKTKPKPKAIRQSVVNLLAQYDDEEARKNDILISLKQVSWNDDGIRQIDDTLVMYNNPLFEETRHAPNLDSLRVDPNTGLRDNSDWVAIFNSYR